MGVGALSVVIVALLASLAVHPIHTTMTELVVDAGRNVVRATVRGFADDLGGAAGPRGLEAYVADRVRLVDRDGKPLAARGCGVRRSGDVVWVCIEAVYRGGAGGLRIANSLLCDRFSDQVNIVQIENGRSRSSLLFTRGAGDKALR